MTLESLLSSTGLGELVDQDFFVAQVMLLAGSLVAFVFSFGLCVIAFRAAATARNARRDAEQFHQSAENLAAEVRSLTAQLERRLAGESARRADAPEARAAGCAPATLRLDAAEPSGESDCDETTRATGMGGASACGETEAARDTAGPLLLGEEREAGDRRADGHARNRQAVEADRDSARANALSFVDGDEDVLNEPADLSTTGFVGAPRSGPVLREGQAGARPRPSAALGSLLRRRRS